MIGSLVKHRIVVDGARTGVSGHGEEGRPVGIGELDGVQDVFLIVPLIISVAAKALAMVNHGYGVGLPQIQAGIVEVPDLWWHDQGRRSRSIRAVIANPR